MCQGEKMIIYNINNPHLVPIHQLTICQVFERGPSSPAVLMDACFIISSVKNNNSFEQDSVTIKNFIKNCTIIKKGHKN